MSEKGVRQYYGTGVQELFCDREGNVKELLLSDSPIILANGLKEVNFHEHKA